MSLEIERRFLVTKDIRHLCPGGTPITQGYLDSEPGVTTRVRIAGDAAFFTIKSRRVGCVRDEFESALPLAVANRLLSRLPADRIIHKTRYYLEHCGGLWEVDYFDGPLNGLVIAEIELLAPDQTVVLPDWVGREITEDHRFGNSSLLSGVVPALDRAA